MGFLSKFLSALKSIRLNEKLPLNGTELDHVLVSAMYAEQQGAYLNSYTTGLNPNDIKKLLEEYWGIYNREGALASIKDLYLQTDEYMNIVFKAYEHQDKYAEILKTELPLENQDEYISIFRELRNAVPDLIEKKVISSFTEIKRYSDIGWNTGRAAFIARCSYEISYISEVELKQILAENYMVLKRKCQTWEDYTKSYIFGRALWGGANNDGMIAIASDLLNNEKSPIKGKFMI